MSFVYKLLSPLLFKVDPERAHGLTIKAMKAGLVPTCGDMDFPSLAMEVWGLKFPNPVGLSAGFDKDAEVIAPALKMGFGFVEAGTVTMKPQEGNAKPRVFRDAANEAVINRMGFPGNGVEIFKANLERFLATGHPPAGVVGLNIGMNKTQKEPTRDYRALIKLLGPMADYIAVNISSPNTPGLRDLQKRAPLTELLTGLQEQRAVSCRDHPPPILVKFAPDLDEDQCAELAEVCLDVKVDGIIVSNTTLDRPEYLEDDFRAQAGGLSGKPMFEKSTAVLKRFYELTGGQIPLVGVGGVSSGAQAYAKIKAGASLVQLYTGLVFKGPSLPQDICREMADLLQADGYAHLSEAVGVDAKTG